MTVREAIAKRRAVKLRAQDFTLLSDSGSFHDYARSELIEGEIWVVQAVHTGHSAFHGALNGLLWAWKQQSGSALVVHSTPTVQVSDLSLPQPDPALAEADEDPMSRPAKSAWRWRCPTRRISMISAPNSASTRRRPFRNIGAPT